MTSARASSPRVLLGEFSVCVLGDVKVGKSSIIQRLANSSFSEKYIATVGIDFESSIIELDRGLVKVNIYDISGQPNFLQCAQTQIENADAFIYVYDMTDKQTFIGSQRWFDIINRHAKRQNLPKMLLGNMLDLRHKQTVHAIDAKEFAIPESMKHVEVSAKTGRNVNAAFFILANDVLNFRRLGTHEKVGYVHDNSQNALHQIHEAPEVKSVTDTADYTHVFRILLLGSKRTGKSAIRLRYCRDYFSPDYYASAGLEYSTRCLLIDGQKVKIQVWDISGDDVYDSIRKSYYRGANGYVVVYDVTNKNTFEHAEKMVKELDMYGQSQCPKIVIGNKSDSGAKRNISYASATDWANGWRLPLLEVSAKNGANIDAAFQKVVMALKDRFQPWKQVYNFSA